MAEDFKDFSKRYTVTPTAEKLINGEQLDEVKHRSGGYAWADVWQSITGLILGIFLFCHMGFTGSILLGEKGSVFETLVGISGGKWIDGQMHLWMHVVFIGFITIVVIIHALLALRKFPANIKALKTMRGHYHMIRHNDTTLWWVQFVTAIFLTALVFFHLIPMLLNPGEIGAEGSGLLVYNYHWWLWVIVLFLIVTELHGMIGLYRLCMKWCGPSDSTRSFLRGLLYLVIICMICLGCFVIWGFYSVGASFAA